MSGEEILVGLLDFSEDVRSMPEDNWKPEAFPRYSALVGKKIWKSKNTAKQYLKESCRLCAGWNLPRTIV